jgi:hypothetical protein
MTPYSETNIQIVYGYILSRNGPKVGLPADISYTIQPCSSKRVQALYTQVKPVRRALAPDDQIEAADPGELCVIQIGPPLIPDPPPQGDGEFIPPLPITIYLCLPEQPVAGPCNPPPAQPTGGG